MSKAIRYLVLFVALLASQLVSTSTEAREWPGHGAGGGRLSKVACPDDKAMVGVTGAAGRFIDRLQIVCATLYADGTYGPPEPYGDPVGGAGGGNLPMVVCPRNAKMFDMTLALDWDDARYFGGLRMNCRPASGAMSSSVFGAISHGVSSLAGSDAKLATQSCPQEHFVGLKIYFKEFVKAVGVVCDSVEITPVAAPKVLKSTGKAKTPPAPSGPPIAHIAAIRGAWNTKTNSDGYFTVILQPQHDGIGPLTNEPIPVTGQFINQQGAHDYDGTLQGVIRPYSRTLEYSYVQKNGAAGTGVFTLSNDGNSLTGSGKGSDGTAFTWNGTRAK